MKYLSNIGKLSLIIFTTFLFGCSSLKINTEVEASNFDRYENVYVRDVKVYSNEKNAAGNKALQVKISEWKGFVREELNAYVNSSEFNTVDASKGAETLVIDMDVEVVYGNRFLRWFVGFGAGRGQVDTVLTVTDAETQKIKFKAVANSEVRGGGGGGDVGKLLQNNIRHLMKKYKQSITNS
jgi:hypothetical protein